MYLGSTDKKRTVGYIYIYHLGSPKNDCEKKLISM